MSHTQPLPRNQQSSTVSGSPAPPTGFDHAMIWIAYVYLLRVPILIGLILVLLPILAMFGLQSLLQNLFILSFGGTIWTTGIALALCWSILLTSRLVRLNGTRFDLPQALHINTLKPASTFVVWLLAVPPILVQFLRRREFELDRNAILWQVGAVILGAIIAYLFAFIGLFVTTFVAPPGNSPADKTFPAPKPLRWLLKFADQHGVPESKLLPLGSLLKRLPEGLRTGYLDPANGLLWSAHWLAFTFAVAIGVFTFALDLYRRTYLGEVSRVPALCYLLILLLNLNWILSFLAFLLDRYRVPLLIPLAVLCALGAHFPASDHYYSSQRGVPVQTITPSDVLTARQGRPIILVASAGGGIQAAAWTTQVLSGLEELSQKDWHTPTPFHKALTLVSSVSGGATGSMYFLNLYGPDTRAIFQTQKVADMQNAVEQSSLDDIGWALAFRDFTRIFVPRLTVSSEDKLLDRGYMLEETWRNRAEIHASLTNWRVGIKDGNRPAVIFNSTITETGEPLLLSTTDLDEDQQRPRARSFYSLYPNTDVPVVTAVRLAATFPFVTPAARIISGKPEYHMIDGGYYDNPGIASLAEWLDEGLRAIKDKDAKLLPDHILIIQIRSFPDEGKEPSPTNRGWFFQASAPIKGLLSVRTSAQLIRDHRELDALARLWSTAPEQGSLQDRIRFATFTFDGSGAPLSWAMSEKQKRDITAGWINRRSQTEEKDRDLKWVHCTLDPGYTGCNTRDKNGPY
jgi:Patatin-like phospholipase